MGFTIKAEPFSWNDNMSEVALEDFSMVQEKLPYGICQSIGMALAKLELLEKQGCKVEGKKMIHACDLCKNFNTCKIKPENNVADCNDFIRKPKTNADKIKAMSDEQLAEFLVNFNNTFGEEYEGEMSCLDWLQSDAE